MKHSLSNSPTVILSNLTFTQGSSRSSGIRALEHNQVESIKPKLLVVYLLTREQVEQEYPNFRSEERKMCHKLSPHTLAKGDVHCYAHIRLCPPP